jgi:hypothetical protein
MADPTRRRSVRELRVGEHVESSFLCTGKVMQERRDGGGKFVRLTLTDATGLLNGVLWEAGASDGFKIGDVVAVSGVCASSPIYGLQLRIETIAVLRPGQYDPEALGLEG